MDFQGQQTDCRSDDGVTIGLIDSLIFISRVLAERDLTDNENVKEALKDLNDDEDFNVIIAAARNA